MGGLVVVVSNISKAAAAEGIRVQLQMADVHDNHGGQGIVKALDVERVLLAVVKGRLSNGHGGLTVSYIVRHELVDVCLVRATSALHPVRACPRIVSTASELHPENLAKLHIDAVAMHDRLEDKVVLVGQVDVPDWGVPVSSHNSYTVCKFVAMDSRMAFNP